MKTHYNDKYTKLYKTDCFKLLDTLPDNSIDLIATDPPYYKVLKEDWDNQWKNPAEFYVWINKVLTEFNRVLKPNGSLYFFACPYQAAKMELQISQLFKPLNHIVWRKNTGRYQASCKEQLTKYFPQTERIIFAESKKPKYFVYKSIQQHLVKARNAAGVTNKEIDQATGCYMSRHWFGVSQWSLPSERHYKTLNKLFGNTLKPYTVIHMQYKKIQKKSRVFKVNKEVPYTDVWDYQPVQFYPGKHPCEKPLELIEHIIKTSSLEGQVVLDTFAGSATTAVAARNLKRNFIGCEAGNKEYSAAVKRLKGKG